MSEAEFRGQLKLSKDPAIRAEYGSVIARLDLVGLSEPQRRLDIEVFLTPLRARQIAQELMLAADKIG